MRRLWRGMRGWTRRLVRVLLLMVEVVVVLMWLLSMMMRPWSRKSGKQFSIAYTHCLFPNFETRARGKGWPWMRRRQTTAGT